VKEGSIVIVFEGVFTAFVQINSGGDMEALLDEPVRQAADTTKQIYDGPPVHDPSDFWWLFPG